MQPLQLLTESVHIHAYILKDNEKKQTQQHLLYKI